jgi:enterochelin esterase family protein
MEHSPLSPRIRKLLADVERETPNAVEAFWAEIEASATPLVEADEADADSRLVTFLWRETEPTENVVLVEWFSNIDRTLASKQLTKLAGSNVWYRTLRLRSDLATTYHFLRNDTFVKIDADPEVFARFARLEIDPLNPITAPYPRNVIGPRLDAGGSASVFVLPDAPRMAIADLPEIESITPPIEQTVASSALDCEKTIWIHAPTRTREAGARCRLLIQTDGEFISSDRLILATLDAANLDAANDPVVTVMVENTDRNAELPCNPKFAGFIADELIPAIRSRYAVAEGPAAVIMAGQSYGGLAAAWVALTRPDAVGNALCQSGSFWWWPQVGMRRAPDQPLGTPVEHAWLPAWVATQPKKEVRFWLEAGLLENTGGEFSPGLLSCNRHMRDVLVAKGYDVAYREFPGGHDSWNWRGIYPDGLRHFLNQTR